MSFKKSVRTRAKILAPALASTVLLFSVSTSLFGNAIPILPGQSYTSNQFGVFNHDNDVFLFSLDLSARLSPTKISIYTTSWAGPIFLDGFTPELTLYLANGSPMGIGGSNSPGTYPAGCGPLLGTADAGGTLGCLDAFIGATLNPGQYLIALTQIGNDPLQFRQRGLKGRSLCRLGRGHRKRSVSFSGFNAARELAGGKDCRHSVADCQLV